MLYLLIAAIIVAGDQAFKYWITQNVQLNSTSDLIPGVIHLTNVHNTGAAFSLMSGMRWVLVGVTAVCVIAMIVALFKMKLGFWGHLTLAMLMGGAIGNGIDRAFVGYVVDMFEVDFVKFAVFNVADCFITVGGILFCLAFILGETKHKKPIPEPSHAKRPPQPGELIIEDDGGEWTETRILESYDLEQLLSKENNNDINSNG